MATGAIVAVATLKGGSGKTTLASCLAVHWRLAGRDPALIDADSQCSLVRLAGRSRALAGVPVIAETSSDVVGTARKLARAHAPVIIDTAGFRAPATLAALAEADLVIVPVKASSLDVDVMIDTVRTLFSTVEGGMPNFRCVLTQTTRDSVIARHIRAELAENGFPVLENELVNRVIYSEATLFGATPSLIQPGSAAAQEIAALADEIAALIDGGKE